MVELTRSVTGATMDGFASFKSLAEIPVTKITKRHSTLAFLRRNLRSFPQDVRKVQRSHLVSKNKQLSNVHFQNIWDPYIKQDIDKLERVQRQAARFITGDHKTREEGCVTRRLETLELPSLEQRRSFNRLVFLYKVVEGLVPAIPPDVFF